MGGECYSSNYFDFPMGWVVGCGEGGWLNGSTLARGSEGLKIETSYNPFTWFK